MMSLVKGLVASKKCPSHLKLQSVLIPLELHQFPLQVLWGGAVATTPASMMAVDVTPLGWEGRGVAGCQLLGERHQSSGVALERPARGAS